MEKLRTLATNALPPLLFFALVLCTWHGAVVLFDIKPFLLPGPLRVASAVADKERAQISSYEGGRCVRDDARLLCDG